MSETEKEFVQASLEFLDAVKSAETVSAGILNCIEAVPRAEGDRGDRPPRDLGRLLAFGMIDLARRGLDLDAVLQGFGEGLGEMFSGGEVDPKDGLLMDVLEVMQTAALLGANGIRPTRDILNELKEEAEVWGSIGGVMH